jgi:hypothetical protein
MNLCKKDRRSVLIYSSVFYERVMLALPETKKQSLKKLSFTVAKATGKKFVSFVTKLIHFLLVSQKGD